MLREDGGLTAVAVLAQVGVQVAADAITGGGTSRIISYHIWA